MRPDFTEAGIPSDGGGVVTEAPASQDAAVEPVRTKPTKRAPSKTRKPSPSKTVDPSPSESETAPGETDETPTTEPTDEAPGPGEICASAPSDDCD